MKTFLAEICETVAGFEAITPILFHSNNIDEAHIIADDYASNWRDAKTDVEAIKVVEVPANHFVILKRYITVMD